MSNGPAISEDTTQGTPQVFHANEKGEFDISISLIGHKRHSAFGPVMCPTCSQHMRSATLTSEGRAFILKCSFGHEKREIGFTCM